MFTAYYTVGIEDPDTLVNNAVASGADALSQAVAASANASVAILKPGIALDKTASAPQPYIGGIITYTYTVTNTGNAPLAEVSVNDNRLGSIPFVEGDTDGDGWLDAGETWIFRATYTIKWTDRSPLVNTATVSGTDALGRIVSASDTTSVKIGCG